MSSLPLRLLRIGSFAGLIGRQLLRNRRRTALTFIGLVISFFLYTTLANVLHVMESFVSETARDSVLYITPRYDSTRSASLPRSYVERVRAMPEVTAATALRFFGGRGPVEGSFAAAIGIEPEQFLQIEPLTGLSETEREAFLTRTTTAVVSQRMLDRQGWKVGERVTIRGFGRGPSFTFDIVGDHVSESHLTRFALVHLDYLEKVLGSPGRASFIEAQIATASLSAATAASIDQSFQNHTSETETVSEKGHLTTLLGSLETALVAMRGIGYLTLLVTVVVVGNSVAMSIRERTAEIGTFRALGFGRREVMALVLGESVAISVLGGVVGALAAFAFFESGFVDLDRFGLQFSGQWEPVWTAALLSVPIGFLAGLQPSIAAVRMPITDALRYAD